MALISVIIPIYNVEKFLDETIQSILNQSNKNWELILIDDGSTDNSALIAEKYLIDSRISLFRQKNEGVSIARNKGLSLAKGKWVYFMDSDDTLDSDFLKTSVEIAELGNYDIVVVGEYFQRRLPSPMALPTCAMFMKNSFLQKYPDIRFPENIQPCEDGLFSHQLLALTDKIGFNPKAIYHYRKHENQNTATLNTDKVLSQIPMWFDILEKFYRKYNLFEKKSTHLALFIEHEPFGRYLKMPFSEQQKMILFRIIQDFFAKHIATNFTEYEKLRKDFNFFLKVKHHTEFEEYCQKFIQNLRKSIKIKLVLAKFIPLKKVRQKIRKQLNWTLEEL